MNQEMITVRGLENASGPGVEIRVGEEKPLPKEKAVMLLNAGFAEAVKDTEETATADKDALVERAAELGIGAPSTLKRWGVEKLSAAIEEAEESTEPDEHAENGETATSESEPTEPKQAEAPEQAEE